MDATHIVRVNKSERRFEVYNRWTLELKMARYNRTSISNYNLKNYI